MLKSNIVILVTLGVSIDVTGFVYTKDTVTLHNV